MFHLAGCTGSHVTCKPGTLNHLENVAIAVGEVGEVCPDDDAMTEEAEKIRCSHLAEDEETSCRSR